MLYLFKKKKKKKSRLNIRDRAYADVALVNHAQYQSHQCDHQTMSSWWKADSHHVLLTMSMLSILELTYVVHSISLQTSFVQAFTIVIDSSKFSMLLLYILGDDWPTFMISASNEQLQQQLEYTLLKSVTTSEFQKCNLDVRIL